MEKKKTCNVIISLAMCAAVFAALTVTAVRFRHLFGLYFGTYRGMDVSSEAYADLYRKLSQWIYICIVLGYAALYELVGLLLRIRKGDIFSTANITALKGLAVLCFIVAAVSLVYARSYMPLYIIMAAAFFIGVILFVIKDVFVNALRIREENELTI